MAKFFKTIDELKAQISVTKSYSIEEFDTRTQYACDKYLLEWIQSAQLDALSSAFDLDPTPPMSSAQSALVAKLQPALANFTFYEHIPFASVVIDDSGIHRKENENYKTAYANQVEQLRRNTLETAFNNLEIMLQFMEDNEADYPLWVASSGYTRNKELFINSSRDFNDQFDINMSRLAFRKIRAIIKDIEQFEIKPMLGGDFYAEIKDLILNKTPFSAEQQIVVDYVKKAIAYFTVAKAVAAGWSMFTVAGLVAVEHDNTTNSQLEKTASNEQASLKIREYEKTAKRWMKLLQQHLTANIADYPTYEADTTVNPVEDDSCPTQPPTGFFRV